MFQLVMAGIIALSQEITAAILVVPLIPFTVWYSTYHFTFLVKILVVWLLIKPAQSIPKFHLPDENLLLTLLGYHYAQSYEPLMKFIALRSIEQISDTNFVDEERPSGIVRRQSTTVDESREMGQRFINPSLTLPLEKMWIDIESDEFEDSNGDSSALLNREESAESTQSLGDAHIWRQPQ